MNLPTILVLVIVVVCFVAALVFICKNGGFGGECTGDCSSCAAAPSVSSASPLTSCQPR